MADIAYTAEANLGWISVERAMRTHAIVGFGKPVPGVDKHRGSFSRAEAWIDMIMMAQHKVTTWINKGRKTELQIGQFPGAYAFLAERWNWSVKTVRNFLERLFDEGMLEKPSSAKTVSETGKQKTNQVQILTISNYSIYQVAREIDQLSKGQAKGNRGASEGQESNNETMKQEERKILSADADSSTAAPIDMFARAEELAAERAGTGGRKVAAVAMGIMAATLPAAAQPPMDPPAHYQQQFGQPTLFAEVDSTVPTKPKRERRRGAVPETYSQDFEEFWKIYPRREGKGEAFKSWSRLTMNQRRKAWVACKNQLAILTARMREQGGNFCPLPATWINQGRFDDEPTVRRVLHETSF
jgi:hypothetical protein